MQVLFLCCPMVVFFITILLLSEKVKAFRNSLAKFERLFSDSLLNLSQHNSWLEIIWSGEIYYNQDVKKNFHFHHSLEKMEKNQEYQNKDQFF